MSAARPRPVRGNKVPIRFASAEERTMMLDTLDWAIRAYQSDAQPSSRATVRRLIRGRRTLRGLVVGA